MAKAIPVKENSKSPIFSGVYELHPIPDASFSENVGIVVRNASDMEDQLRICRRCPARNESLKISTFLSNGEFSTIVSCRPIRKKMRLCVDY